MGREVSRSRADREQASGDTESAGDRLCSPRRDVGGNAAGDVKAEAGAKAAAGAKGRWRDWRRRKGAREGGGRMWRHGEIKGGGHGGTACGDTARSGCAAG